MLQPPTATVLTFTQSHFSLAPCVQISWASPFTINKTSKLYISSFPNHRLDTIINTMPGFQVYLIHMMSFLFMAVSFIAKMLGSFTLIFGLDHPAVLIRRAQATAIIISFSLFSSFKYDFIQAHGLRTITLVYISFFSALSRTHTLDLITTLRAFSWILFMVSDTNSVWLVQLWVQSIWSLLEYGYTSTTFIGRHGLLLIGQLLRLLLLNIWDIGLINIQVLQHDARTRFEQAISAIIGRVPAYFFGR